MIQPALVIMACLAVLAPAFGAETPGPTDIGIEPEIADVAKKVYPSVVRVEVPNRFQSRVATGVVIEKGGYVVTTALAVPRGGKIVVTTSEGKSYEAEFLGFDTETQLALLRVKDAGLPALTLGKDADVAPGSWICVVGVSPERTAAVTQGIVSSVTEDRLRLNVWVTPGMAGGPVVDANGRMIGLLRGIYMDEKPVVFQFRDKEQTASGYVFSSRAQAPSSGMAVAVPVDIVKDISAQIKEKGKVPRGWLGVNIGMDEDDRTVIVSVDRESPAELAKLQAGDVVLKIGDRDVTSSDVLAAEIRKKKPGQDITLKIEREGKPMDVKAKLGELAEAESIREMDVRFPDLFRQLEPGPLVKPKPGSPEAPLLTPRSPRPFAWSYETQKFIGVYCGELNRELAEHFGVKEGTGLLISRLTEGGPAEKAKLKVGDVIVRVDGQRVETVDELIDLVQSKARGSKVKVEYLRDKKEMSADVEVLEEKGGDLFGSDDFQGFLESWQGYTDAFRNELRKWQSEGLPEFKQSLKKLSIKGLSRRV
jgi:S1-C subfamily serine protease